MSRFLTCHRLWSTLAIGLALPAVLSSVVLAEGREARKPNLLFILTDEQRADTMGAYGNTKIHTPNLNALAAESAVFERAYVTQPVCTPSRSSLLTGLWPHTNGLTANNIPLPATTRCLPELLGDASYRTAHMGKWHLGDEIFAQHGFQQMVSIEDGYNRFYGKGRDRDARSSYHRFLADKGYDPGDGNMFSRGFAARLPIEHCKPKFLETEARNFLRRHRNEPFVLYVSFLEPHMPFFGPLDAEHDPAKVDLPVNFADPLEANEPMRYRINREACRARYGHGEKEIRELIARYWGLVTQVDRSVGEILDTLDELGLTDNTIVVFTSDHGDMMGAHRMVEKCTMYEEAVRIPWLMRIPRMQDRPRVIKRRVSQIDMVPTLLELMAAAAPDHLQGKSLVPLIEGRHVAAEPVFIEWSPGQSAVRPLPPGSSLASKEEIERVARDQIRTVISPDGWKLCLSTVDKSQLFNLNEDPGETRNLFDSGRHQQVIDRLTQEIRRWQDEVDDTLKLPG